MRLKSGGGKILGIICLGEDGGCAPWGGSEEREEFLAHWQHQKKSQKHAHVELELAPPFWGGGGPQILKQAEARILK